MENASLTGTAAAFNSELNSRLIAAPWKPRALGAGLARHGEREGGSGCPGQVWGLGPSWQRPLGAAPALKSCFGSQAIFEARNVSVTNASALSHTFHVTQDCAQS